MQLRRLGKSYSFIRKYRDCRHRSLKSRSILLVTINLKNKGGWNLQFSLFYQNGKIFIRAVLCVSSRNCLFIYERFCNKTARTQISSFKPCLSVLNRSYANEQFRELQNRSFTYEQFSVQTVFLLKWHFFTFAGFIYTQFIFLAVLTPFGKNIDWFLYSFYLYFGHNKLEK